MSAPFYPKSVVTTPTAIAGHFASYSWVSWAAQLSAIENKKGPQPFELQKIVKLDKFQIKIIGWPKKSSLFLCQQNSLSIFEDT